MKIRVGTLRRVIKEAAMGTKSFSRTVNRIMTPYEARERAVDMGLDDQLANWLEDQFEQIQRWHGERGRAEDQGVGENGRAAMGQSWEEQYIELAAAMGYYDAYPDDDFVATHPDVEKVWNAFFEE